MATMDPKVPIKADHRFIQKVISITLRGKVEYRPSEFDRISRVFYRMGGSWERLFNGSPEDISRLKKIIKLAYKGGFLTKKEPWV